jgi:hypothetical protein
MALETENDFADEFFQKYNEQSERFCFKTNKMSFATKTQAKKHRTKFESKHQSYFGVYQCTFCKDWHLTTIDKDERKNRNGRQSRK